MWRIVSIHECRSHGHIKFHSIGNLSIDLSEVSKILKNLGNVKVPAIFETIEEDVVKIGMFDEDIREYLSEEFCCIPELSFPLLCTLQYMKTFNISVEEALADLYQLSSQCSMCVKCDIHPNGFLNSNEYIERYCAESLEGELPTHLADSHPPTVLASSRFCATSISYRRSKDVIKEKVLSNPFLSSKDDDVFIFKTSEDEQFKVNNPFMIMNDIEENGDMTGFSPEANSTELNLSGDKKSKSVLKCEYCRRVFTNSNNLKQHLIRHFIEQASSFKCTNYLINHNVYVKVKRYLFIRSKMSLEACSITVLVVSTKFFLRG